jgi:two-component system, NtrC family, sensor kinase
MRLAAKLLALGLAGALLVIGIETFLGVRYDVRMFEGDMRRDDNQTAQTLAALVEDSWKVSGQKRALQLIQDANDGNQRVKVRFVWLDAPSGDAHAPQVASGTLHELSAEGETLRQADKAGHASLYTYVPLRLPATRPAALEVSSSLQGLDRFRRNSITRAGVIGLILLAGSGFAFAIYNVLAVGRPLKSLIEKTRRVGAGDLSGPLAISPHDELSELAIALNRMCDDLSSARDRLRAETEARIGVLQQLRHADRLKTVGKLAAGMAHELGTPMNVAAARAELIAETTDSQDVAASAKIIKGQIDKMTAIIRQLLDFARRPGAQKQRASIAAVSQGTVQLLTSLAESKYVHIVLSGVEEPLTAEIDPRQIEQVLTNLIVNAIQAMPDGGTVRVTLDAGPFPSSGGSPAEKRRFARIDVRDEGTGIPHDQLERIFDPFFTTKKSGEGTGLGLSIVDDIVREHGGWIDVSSVVNEGSCFSVFLPLCPDGRQSPEVSPAAPHPERLKQQPNACPA